jgi:hypothetical protein
MKSLRLTFSAAILLSVLILSGCGGDDDPDPKAQIVGKWEITKAESKITPSSSAFVTFLVSQGLSQPDAQELVDEITDPDNVASTGGTIEVKSDGKYEQTDDSGKTTGTWELSSDGKTLTLDKGTNNMQVATVSKLDGSAMELDFDYTGDLGFPSSSGLGFHVILTFKKV